MTAATVAPTMLVNNNYNYNYNNNDDDNNNNNVKNISQQQLQLQPEQKQTPFFKCMKLNEEERQAKNYSLAYMKRLVASSILIESQIDKNTKLNQVKSPLLKTKQKEEIKRFVKMNSRKSKTSTNCNNINDFKIAKKEIEKVKNLGFVNDKNNFKGFNSTINYNYSQQQQQQQQQNPHLFKKRGRGRPRKVIVDHDDDNNSKLIDLNKRLLLDYELYQNNQEPINLSPSRFVNNSIEFKHHSHINQPIHNPITVNANNNNNSSLLLSTSSSVNNELTKCAIKESSIDDYKKINIVNGQGQKLEAATETNSTSLATEEAAAAAAAPQLPPMGRQLIANSQSNPNFNHQQFQFQLQHYHHHNLNNLPYYFCSTQQQQQQQLAFDQSCKFNFATAQQFASLHGLSAVASAIQNQQQQQQQYLIQQHQIRLNQEFLIQNNNNASTFVNLRSNFKNNRNTKDNKAIFSSSSITSTSSRKGELKKCRKVYGMDSRDLWCTQCKWKKACSRFSNQKTTVATSINKATKTNNFLVATSSSSTKL